MTEAELVKLLAVARERPLLDALTVRRGPRKGERYANVWPEVRDRLALLGRERARTYKTLVLTGLRKGERASLTVAHLRLDEALPHLTLDAANEKNREGNAVPLWDDLRGRHARGALAGPLRLLRQAPPQAPPAQVDVRLVLRPLRARTWPARLGGRATPGIVSRGSS
jgi:integrase